MAKVTKKLIEAKARRLAAVREACIMPRFVDRELWRVAMSDDGAARAVDDLCLEHGIDLCTAPALVAHFAALEARDAWHAEIRGAVLDAYNAARTEAQAAWIKAGGCPSCKGSGGHSTYDDYWPCTGIDGAGCLGYGQNLAVRPHDGLTTSVAYPSAGWVPADADLAEWYYAIEAHDRTERLNRSLSRGKIAIITKGRKVPTGTIGPIVAVIDGNYGDRVGMLVPEHIDPSGMIWTAASNVEVAMGVDDEPRREMMERYEKNRGEFMRSKGRESKPFYTPEQWAGEAL